MLYMRVEFCVKTALGFFYHKLPDEANYLDTLLGTQITFKICNTLQRDRLRPFLNQTSLVFRFLLYSRLSFKMNLDR